MFGSKLMRKTFELLQEWSSTIPEGEVSTGTVYLLSVPII